MPPKPCGWVFFQIIMLSSKVYHVYLVRSSPFPDPGPNQLEGWKDRHSLLVYVKPDKILYSQLFQAVKETDEDRFLQFSLSHKDIKDYTHSVSFYSHSKDFSPTGVVITQLNSSERFSGVRTILKNQEQLLLCKQQQQRGGLQTTKQCVTLVRGAHSKELFCCLHNLIYDFKRNCLYSASHPCSSSNQLNRQVLLTEYTLQFLAATAVIVKKQGNESRQQAEAARPIFSSELSSERAEAITVT